MGKYIKRFDFWNPGTWAIPQLYWDAFSNEQRFHAICKQLGKVISYADYLGVNVDDIAERLKAIEEGQLDPYIIAEIEQWFNDNQPAIVQALADLRTDVDGLDAIIGNGFTPLNTVTDNVGNILGMIGSGFSDTHTIADDIDMLKHAHVLADPDIKVRIVDPVLGDDATGEAVHSQVDLSHPYATLQAAFNEAIFEGTDVRIYFNRAGTYDLEERIIAGCVVHLMSNTNANGNVIININNTISYESLFFYDSHLNLSGTVDAPIYLVSDHQIECEGSTLWTIHSTITCEYLYLIQGSMQANDTVFNCNIIMRYCQSVMRACVFHNTAEANAVYAVCSIIRFEVDPDSGRKCIVDDNANGANYACCSFFTCMVYGHTDTLESRNTMMTAYKYFWDIHSTILFNSNTSWETASGWAQSGNQIAQFSILNERIQQEHGGYFTTDAIASGDYQDINITYNMTFYAVPFVFTQLQVGSSATDTGLTQVQAYVANRTTTGCTIRVINGSASSRTVTVMWRAEI